MNALPLFHSLDSEELARATSPAEERSVGAGETVVERWESSRDFYVVLAGTAEVRIDGEVIGGLGPGEFFGELAALEWEAGFSYPRLASVAALTDLRLLVFPEGTLDDLIRDFPSVGTVIRAAATQRIARH
jgi:CRP-like cAMP-binding protein